MSNCVTVVLDIGYHKTRCGFGGNTSPENIFPSIFSFNESGENYYFGRETDYQPELDVYQILTNTGGIRYPEHYEALLNDIFYRKLDCYPSETAVLMSCSPFELYETEEQKQFIHEVMFETFSTPFFKMEQESLLSLFETGKTTGVVLEIAQGKNYCVGIEEGNLKLNSLETLDFSGISSTFYLYDLLMHIPHFRDRFHVSGADLDFIKSKYCFVAQDYNLEVEKLDTMDTHEECILPDGQKFTLTYEKFSVGESFFQPIITDNVKFNETDGIQYLLYNSLKKLNHKKYKESIVLSGGSCNFTGLQTRLEKEFSTLFKEEINCYKTNNCELSTWLGGSVYSSMSNFENDICISLADYQENGYSKFV